MCDHEHDRAVGRLSAARGESERLAGEYRAVASGQLDVLAHTELRGAREEVTARERWLEWVDSDGPIGSGLQQSTVEKLEAR